MVNCPVYLEHPALQLGARMKNGSRSNFATATVQKGQIFTVSDSRLLTLLLNEGRVDSVFSLFLSGETFL